MWRKILDSLTLPGAKRKASGWMDTDGTPNDWSRVFIVSMYLKILKSS